MGRSSHRPAIFLHHPVNQVNLVTQVKANREPGTANSLRMNLTALESRLMKHRPVAPRGGYPPAIFPLIERVAAQGVPAKAMVEELLKEPEFQGRTRAALYRRIRRHLAAKSRD